MSAVLHGLVAGLRAVMYACFAFGLSYYARLLLWGTLSLRLLGRPRWRKKVLLVESGVARR